MKKESFYLLISFDSALVKNKTLILDILYNRMMMNRTYLYVQCTIAKPFFFFLFFPLVCILYRCIYIMIIVFAKQSQSFEVERRRERERKTTLLKQTRHMIYDIIKMHVFLFI